MPSPVPCLQEGDCIKDCRDTLMLTRDGIGPGSAHISSYEWDLSYISRLTFLPITLSAGGQGQSSGPLRTIGWVCASKCLESADQLVDLSGSPLSGAK
jgi:hypothetical protein